MSNPKSPDQWAKELVLPTPKWKPVAEFDEESLAANTEIIRQVQQESRECTLTEESVREVLGEAIREDGSVYLCGFKNLGWEKSDKDGILISGRFTAQELACLAWWLVNKG